MDGRPRFSGEQTEPNFELYIEPHAYLNKLINK